MLLQKLIILAYTIILQAVCQTNRQTHKQILSKCFSCSTKSLNTQLFYFSVPYDKGWTAYIDNVETDIVNSGGMMMLPVKEGEHSIVFRYNTLQTYLSLGISNCQISAKKLLF